MPIKRMAESNEQLVDRLIQKHLDPKYTHRGIRIDLLAALAEKDAEIAKHLPNMPALQQGIEDALAGRVHALEDIDRIAALEAENARLRAGLEAMPCECHRGEIVAEVFLRDGQIVTEKRKDPRCDRCCLLCGDDSALKAALEEAYLKGAREALLEALSHEVQCGAKEYSEMVVPSASIRMLETALEDVKDVQ